MDATNSRVKKKRKSDGVVSIADQDIIWFKECSSPSPELFFDRFDIIKREDGHRRYTRALRSCNISEQDRTLLANNFEAWKETVGVLYWECRNTKMVAQTSAWRTVSNIIVSSEPFVDNIITSNAKDQRQYSTMSFDSSHISDMQDKTCFPTAEGSSSDINSRVHGDSSKTHPSRLLPTPSYHSESENISSSPVGTPPLFRRELPLRSSNTEAGLLCHPDPVDLTTTLEHFKVLNQVLAWIVKDVDMVKQFRSFQPQHLYDFSLSRGGIADMRHGSKFRASLTPQISATAGKVEPTTTNIHTKWPTLEGILNRVFVKSHYNDVSEAVRNEDSLDPVVVT
ncbi:hypothetical protein FBU30_008475 [Linnemannia zychae]|nr:hypothetical protein FBU30_008475 [Linnemannia zychae]